MPHPARNRHPAEQIPTAVSETTAVRRARQGRKGAPQETVVDITQRSESERRRLLAHGAAAAETPAKTGRSPATVVIYDGIRFASTGEGKRYLELRAAQERGEISDLRCHPEFLLDEAFVDNDGTAYGLCRYTADFIYRQRDGGVWAVEDFKGWKGLDKENADDFPRTAHALRPLRRRGSLAHPDLLAGQFPLAAYGAPGRDPVWWQNRNLARPPRHPV